MCRTEPNTGLETLKLKTRAVKTSDGGYEITGEKMYSLPSPPPHYFPTL